ncbi:hypothetical protein PR048_002865 [Dryococelus australis]|uniref:FLYWCH-type domain-containing protein n=1 Tax=Dryococelus australis TaxID=614101 RepID=A0ABQ9INP3_9NEOP|nr:hypothetical protein PR048_002865 [Dryococelus australis]
MKGKKREKNPDKWKRNVRKIACARGESYVSARGKTFEAKKQGPACVCKNDERDAIYTQFRDIGDKIAQDSYLSGLIQPRKISRTEDDVEPGEAEYLYDPGTSSAADPKQKKKSHSYYYKIYVGSKTAVVCKTAFCNLHAVDKCRVHKLAIHAATNVSPRVDQRVRHSNRPQKITDKTHKQIEDHIKSFPHCFSHYSRKE